mgnify:CR=1 FL=1
MALIEYDVYKQKLRDLEPELKKLGDALDIDAVAQEAARLEDETTQDGFWNNLERSQKVQTRLKQLQNKLHRFKKLMSTWEDLTTLCEMGQEAEDAEILEELKTEYTALETSIEEIRMTTLLSGEYDANNVILQLHSGAGGTEAQDWCQMLYRMYTRWAERHGYAWKTLDYEECDEAGIKSAVISIEGENAYGLLKSEHGVHRLVRVSPFDANARRQTSFAAVEVMPELPDDVEVEIRPEDIEMQACRSSGAGGQHINKTSSAVRLIHKPTGMIAECQEERSQFQNREKAMRLLASRLYEAEREKRESAYDAERRSQVGSGDRSQRIRTYNFPQGRVTDHRIGLTLYKIDAIMDGALDELIDALVTADQAEKLKQGQEAE